jgi:very-short-patch-repair endonuclease
MSALEDQFELQLKAAGLPAWEREHRFHDTRRWRLDFAWPELFVAVELEGGTWVQGRHVRGAGFEADCEKYNTAAAWGWTVYRFTPGMVKSGEALKVIEEALRDGNQ